MKLNKHIIIVGLTTTVMLILSINIADARTNRRICMISYFPPDTTVDYWRGRIVQLKKDERIKCSITYQGKKFLTCEDFSKQIHWNTSDICFEMKLGVKYGFESSARFNSLFIN
jgi:hypothetical protein